MSTYVILLLRGRSLTKHRGSIPQDGQVLVPRNQTRRFVFPSYYKLDSLTYIVDWRQSEHLRNCSNKTDIVAFILKGRGSHSI